MKIFISGASGFIGKNVLNQLIGNNHDILATSSKKNNFDNKLNNVDWIFGDLKDINFLKTKVAKFNPDVTIHLAWESIPSYSKSICRLNLNNSIRLLNFIAKNTDCKKIIASGSCWEYGKDLGSCKESDKLNINSYFNWAKFSLYQYLAIICAEKDINLNWFRIFYVYGLGQRDDSLIPTLIKSIKNNRMPSIINPLNKNDFIYIDDVVNIFSNAVEMNLPFGVYNLGSGKSSSVYDISLIVEKELLSSSSISFEILKNGSKDERVNFWADMDKTFDALNISELTDLNIGIRKFIKNYLMEIG